MDGRGRVLDNVFVERWWRSVKYGEVYLKEYCSGWEAESSLVIYFHFYSHERRYQSLGYRTPWRAAVRIVHAVLAPIRKQHGAARLHEAGRLHLPSARTTYCDRAVDLGRPADR